ncbi:aldo/keto reductase [Corynebacterium pacaense]|uniref:aldo/keto reductase n=1 Tax=Corynebacterium pacaense TaxID=1816684 RepID=UPI0009B94F01|nr:aldo/keto reductase [Corynebacterium pacaense]
MGDMVTPTLTLNDGSDIPQIGLGTWKLGGEEAYRVVRTAIGLGYRHIDTATLYGNEEEIGRALADAIAAGDATRDELFITSKVWNSDQGAERTPRAFQGSLRLLGLDYLDLYLVHWPCPQQGLYDETFEAIARLQGLGQIQSIGVANFYPEVLEDLVRSTGIVPAVNQVELHPGFSQPDLRELHLRLGVTTTAWAPLGRGRVLDQPVIRAIAAEHGVGAGAVVLRWLLQLGCVAIPKSSNEQRLRANLDISGFVLDEQQMRSITELDHSEIAGRMYQDPRDFPGQNP